MSPEQQTRQDQRFLASYTDKVTEARQRLAVEGESPLYYQGWRKELAYCQAIGHTFQQSLDQTT